MLWVSVEGRQLKLEFDMCKWIISHKLVKSGLNFIFLLLVVVDIAVVQERNITTDEYK